MVYSFWQQQQQHRTSILLLIFALTQIKKKTGPRKMLFIIEIPITTYNVPKKETTISKIPVPPISANNFTARIRLQN